MRMSLPVLLLLCAGVSGGLWQWWQQRDNLDSLANANGFVAVGMPREVEQGVVMIVIPHNCPSERAQRGQVLFEALAAENISATRTSRFSFEHSDPATLRRLNLMFRRGPPLVFVNGMVMSNPSVIQTLAEYRRTQTSR